MKKSYLSVGAIMLAVLLLAGCGGGKTPAETDPATTPGTTADTSDMSDTVIATDAATPEDTLAVTDPVTDPVTTPDTAPVTDRATDPVTDPVTEPVTKPETETETETETVPEPRASVELVAKTLAVGEADVTLRMEAILQDMEGAAGVLSAVLSDDTGVISERTLTAAAGNADIVLSCPADRLSGALTLSVTATVEGRVTDELVLKLRDKLPQLTPDGVRCVVAAMSDEEKAALVVGNYAVGAQGISGGTVPLERFGVPGTLVMDGPAGIRYNQSVWYPSVINVSSSWDTELATRVGVALGKDALSHGFDIVLAPGINIQKNVLGGRNFEYASEDPVLSGLMIAPYVSGIQSTGAGTSLKHYAANNQETSRGTVSATVTERALREIYLKAFGIVVADAQPMTVMSSYNRINGTYSATNRDLLVGILREEFGFEGMVMSDWGAQGSMVDKVNAMNDMNMPGDDGDADAVLAGLQAGTIDNAALDACCYNILTTVTRSATYNDVEMNTAVDYRGNGAVATEAATDGMVLLQNESAALPLSPGTSVALFGNGSTATVFGGAGSGGVTPRQSTTIFDGLHQHDGITLVNTTDNPFLGCAQHDASDLSKDVSVSVEYAERMADAADVAVIVISRGSSEGADRTARKGDFLLGDTERLMLERVSEAFIARGKRVVVLLNTGSPIEVASWQALTDAILWVGYPGQGAGTAVAQVLTGEVNPSGKTTITWPTSYASTPAATYFPGSASDATYYEDIYVGYRYYETFDVPVSFPFGFGLSYTTFAYSDFILTENGNGTVSATVTVKNTGAVAGREVVQLYVTKPETLQEQAALELCGFAKTALLAPGDAETVTITVRMEALMTYDTAESRWVLDAGTYTYRVGASVAGPHSRATVTVTDVQMVMDVENRCEPIREFDYIQKDTYTVPDLSAPRVNLLAGKDITSNYDENAELVADFAIDGDYITRWSGLGLSSGDNHVLDIDLGATYAIGEFNILWESIHAPFTVLYSTDGVTYTEHDIYLDDGSMRTFINLYGAEARYIRLQIMRTGQAVSIFEIEAYEATAEDIEAGKNPGGDTVSTNIALGKPVTVSSVEGAYVAENAVDGNIATRWGSLQSGEGWLVVDLEAVTDISRIRVMLEAAWVPYAVEYSIDGDTYTTLCTLAKDVLLVDERDLDIQARYIRIRRDGSDWFSIYELEVYGG